IRDRNVTGVQTCALPISVSIGGSLPAWICLRKNRIVGHFGVLPVVLTGPGGEMPICWTRDLIVAPEVRHAGVGPLLVMTACTDEIGRASCRGGEERREVR